MLPFGPFEPLLVGLFRSGSHEPDEDHDTGNTVFLIHVVTHLFTSWSCRSVTFDGLSCLGQRSLARQLPELPIHRRSVTELLRRH